MNNFFIEIRWIVSEKDADFPGVIFFLLIYDSFHILPVSLLCSFDTENLLLYWKTEHNPFVSLVQNLSHSVALRAVEFVSWPIEIKRNQFSLGRNSALLQKA